MPTTQSTNCKNQTGFEYSASMPSRTPSGSLFYFVLMLIVFCGFLSPAPAVAQTGGTPFTFVLKSSATTSAGVYKKDGTLIRTLWNNVKYTAGTYSKTWDKKDDDGNVMPDGDYDVKVLSNNVKYIWEGVVGNTSTAFSGTTVFHEFERLSGMAIGGNNAYFASGYNEAQNAQFKADLSSPNEKKSAAPKRGNGQETNFVATDGNYVYWAGRDPFASNYTVHYVFATKVSDNTEVDFGANGNSTYVSPLNVKYTSLIDFISGNTNAFITGIAVQKTGSYLFVSHGLLNRIDVLNKTTGAMITTVALTSPGLLAVDANDNLWVQSGNSIRKYIVGSGSLSASSPTITVNDPVGVGISQDGSIIAIADAGTQQVKAFYTASGSAAWTLGQAGGYSTDATVTDTKFFFGDSPHGPEKQTFIAFQSDGSFWVGDSKNVRALRFSADRSRVLDRIMYIPHSRSCSVDPNNPSRVISDYLEFSVDYSKPLSPNNGSWTLVKNWGYGISGNGTIEVDNLIYTTTLKNGRTYSLARNKDGKGLELVELPPSGNLRFTGIIVAGSYQDQRLYPDGSLKRVSRFIVGQGTTFTRRALTGFDGANNPVWEPETTLLTSPLATMEDPFYRGLVAWGLNPVPQTSTGLTIAYEGGGTYPTQDNLTGGFSTKWHLGALKDNKWVWRTAKGLPKTYTGDYPTDGSYDMGNGVVYPGGPLVVQDRNIFWNYHGEFWKNGQTNKWQHVYDNGLMVGVFGVTGADNANGQQLQWQSAVPEMAGNSLSAGIVKIGEDYYIYHCDESHHGGVHRWKITDLNTIQETLISISTNSLSSTVPPAPDLLADDAVNTLKASHALGTSEIMVSENGGAYTTYPGEIKVGDIARAAGYWKFKTKAATGRPESAEVLSPAFSAAATTPAAGYKVLPGKIEAETFDVNEGMFAESTSDASGNKDMRYIDAGDWLDYKVFVPAAGMYTFSTRLVSYNQGGAFEVRTESGTVLGTVTIPNTFAYQRYVTVNSTISLPAGNQVLRLYAIKEGFSLNWFEVVTPSTPATGYAVLPGRVEAEDYQINNGLREEITNDVSGGKHMGFIDAGDFLDYNVFVPTAGTYTFSARVASAGSGGAFDIMSVNGTVLGTLNVTYTGGWQNWITMYTTLTLPAGNQTLRLYMKTSGFNLNYFDVGNALTPISGFVRLPARVEAENSDARSGMSVQTTTDIGGGYNLAGIRVDNWLDYNVFVPSSGIYTFGARVATDVSGGSFEIRTTNGEVLGTINVPVTRSGQIWTTTSISVNLKAGNQTFRLYVKGGGFNLNWWEVSGGPSPVAQVAPTVSLTAPGSGSSFTAPATLNLSANAADSDGTIAKVEFFQGSTKLGEDLTAPYTYNWSGVAAGTYSITARATDNQGLSTTSAAVSVTVAVAASASTSPVTSTCSATGSILREYWANVSGTGVSAIPLNTTPTSSTQLTSFEAPTNVADNYGQRIRGYLCVPVSGDYTFYFASDDNGELWLSTSSDPAAKQRIAYVSDWTNPREWTRSASQKSATITLQANTKYYIEALAKEAGGGDNLAVGWITPGSSSIVVIPGSSLSPFTAPVAQVAPTVSLTAPGSGSSFTAPATLNLSANAADSDGTIAKVEFFQGSTKLGEDLTAPYTYNWSGVAAGTYSITARATDNQGLSTTSAAVSVTVAVAASASTSPVTSTCSATGSILREYWANVSGTGVSAIPLNTTPTSSTQLTSFEAPTNVADNYGQRIRGYLCVPVSGDYTFYFASDDNGELWLSTSSDPAAKQRIAYVSDWTNPREWTRSASQKSATITLQANTKYYIEALAKEAGGGDNLAVGWITPGSSSIVVIPGSSLSPFTAPVAQVAPTVSLTAPGSGSSFTAPATLNLSANAADSDGTIAKVEFFQGSTKLGEDLTAPYTYNWSGVAAGTYSITARATDNQGLSTTSAAVSVTVAVAASASTSPVTSTVMAGYVTLPAKVEAEAYVKKSGLVEQTCTDIGGGLNLASMNTDTWTEYNVYLATAGTFTFNARVSSPNSTGKMEVRTASGAVLATISSPNTGGWQNWVTVPTTISLPAGNQTLRLYVTSGGFNLNWWEVTVPNSLLTRNSSTSVDVAGLQRKPGEENPTLLVYPNPFQSSATIDFSIPAGLPATVELYTIQGALIDVLYKTVQSSGGTTRVQISGSRYLSGAYICRLTYGSKVLFQKVILQK